MADSKKPKQQQKRPKPDMTTEQAMRYLFPKKLRDRLKETAHEKDDKPSEQG